MESEQAEPGAKTRKCDRCGQVRPCTLEQDPFFIEGIYREDGEYSWWCAPCLRQRRDDI